MLKTTKRYIFSTEAVNRYKFWVSSKGIDVKDYNNNPILLFMHNRAFASKKEDVFLPVGRCTDLQCDDKGVWTCQLWFDENDPFAVQLYNKYENGTLNMLSACLNPVEVSDDMALVKEGQAYPCVTKSILEEISCADIGGNQEACAVELCGTDKKLIKLSAESIRALITTKTHNEDQPNMKIKLSAKATGLLKLADGAEMEADEAIEKLVKLAHDEATRATEQEGEKTKLETKVTELEDKVKLASQASAKIKLNAAVNQKIITRKDADNLLELTEGDETKIDKFLEGKTPNPSIKDVIANQATDTSGEVAELVKLSYDELFLNGGLVKLKAKDSEAYKAKFKEKFGREPQNV